MKLIVGLGNPGAEYEGTRHNIGFRIVEEFAAKFRISLNTHEKNSMTGRGRVAGNAVVVSRPLTFMNLSGSAVRLLSGAYCESLSELMVVYDDIDLPVGRLRIREHGSSGTHNGMRSIVEELQSEKFARLRFGIRPQTEQPSRLRDFVLDTFDEAEREVVEQGVSRALDALLLFVRGDLRRAMNEFNRDPVEPVAEESR